jgi:hypothetical protein
VSPGSSADEPGTLEYIRIAQIGVSMFLGTRLNRPALLYGDYVVVDVLQGPRNLPEYTAAIQVSDKESQGCLDNVKEINPSLGNFADLSSNDALMKCNA